MKRLWIKLYTRRCKGCDVPEPHDSHLTWLGRMHYIGGLW